MAIILEGVGDDWLIVRQPGGGVQLHTFSSTGDIPILFRKLLAGVEAPKPTRLVAVNAVNGTGVSALNGNGRARSLRIVSPLKVKPAPVLPDCSDCGACCAPLDPSSRVYVGLEQADVNRLPLANRPDLVTMSGGVSYMTTKKHSSGRRICSAFSGEIGGPCSCSVYSVRPDACRRFERGSADCLRSLSVVVEGSTV